MRLYLDLQFSHTLSPDGPFPSAGGFEVRLNDDEIIPFDFLETAYTVDRDDPTILHVECHRADYDSFDTMCRLVHRMMDICDITDCYVDLDEFQDTDMRMTRVLSFVLESLPVLHLTANQNVTATVYSETVCQYALSDTLLARYNQILMESE